uniref:CSON002740 protein n=1 Tax=Culicoides sonorensis TaxID=179676 RepID=A0A336MM61_CULSO
MNWIHNINKIMTSDNVTLAIVVESFNGSELRLPRLERRQMGAYLCIASNDVPPAVSKRVSLSVHFAPSVRAPSQLLGAPLGSDVQLECHVEASPTPVSYWLKGGRVPQNGFIAGIGGIGNGLEVGQPRPEMLLDGPKYMITEKRNGFRGIMTLLVRSFSPSDVGTYHCVSTNSLGRAEGTLRLYEIKIHGSNGIGDSDQLNIIGGLAEATRDRGNSGSKSVIKSSTNQIITSILLVMTSLGIYFLTSTISLVVVNSVQNNDALVIR